MKNLKKLVAVVLTLAMVLGTLAISVSAASYSDVERSSRHAEAIDILSSLGILKGDEQGNFNPDAEIKRSEFAAVVCRALGQENAANGARGFSAFPDVSVDHWGVGYINWAAQQGIVSGRDAYTFDPDAPVKYQEAVKMLVAALGYDLMAQSRGGYPTGYLVIAASNNITSNVSLSSEANAPRAAVAQLTYDSLDVPLMDTVTFTIGGNDEYAIYNGRNGNEYRTILNHHLNIAKIRATVKDTHKSNPNKLFSRYGQPKVDLEVENLYRDTEENVSDLVNASVMLREGNTFTPYIGDTNAADYLGYTVIAYAGVNDDDDPVLYAIAPETSSNEVIEITKDIDSIVMKNVTGDTNVYKTLEYWENIDTDRLMEKLDVDKNTAVYVNGTKVGGIDSAELDQDIIRTAAKIVLMAPKNNPDRYNKIFITRYEYMVVDSVDIEEKFITAKSSVGAGSVELSTDAHGTNFTYSITLDGEAITLDDLEENDILNLAWAGGDGDATDVAFVDIIVSRKTVEGTVRETKDNPIKYGIDGVYYEKAPGAKSITIGDEGVFYLTIDDKILFMEVIGGRSESYAFITKYDFDTKFGESSYSVKLFTKDGDLVVYPVNTSNLRVVNYASNGTRTSISYGTSRKNKQSEIFGVWNDDKDVKRFEGGTLSNAMYDVTEDDIAQRFITYKVSNGEITEIAFAKETSSRDAFNYAVASDASYAPSTSRFGNYRINKSSKLFYIPLVGNDVEEDKIELKNFSSLDEDENYGNAFIFNYDTDRNIGAAVITKDVGFGGKNNGLAIVQSRSTGLDSDGNPATMLTVVQAGETKNFAVNSDVSVISAGGKEATFGGGSAIDEDFFGKGDIILYTLNGKDEISQIYAIYNATTREITDQLIESDGEMSNKISISFGVLMGVTPDITLATKRFDATSADKEKYLGFDRQDGSTMAMFDETKKSSATGFITSYRDFGSLRASSDASSSTRRYLAVVKTDNNIATDIVSIAVKTDELDSTIHKLKFVGFGIKSTPDPDPED